MQAQVNKYEVQEIVWAKVVGRNNFIQIKIHGGQLRQTLKMIQIASIQSKQFSGNQEMIKVNFLADDSQQDMHLKSAELQTNRIKKWNNRPKQEESKKLKEAIQIAEQILIEDSIEIHPHELKQLITDLQKAAFIKTEISTLLDRISNDELIHIIKMNQGQLLFEIYQIIKDGTQEELQQKTGELITCLLNKVGYANKKVKTMSFDEEQLTKDVFGQSPHSSVRKNTNIDQIDSRM